LLFITLFGMTLLPLATAPKWHRDDNNPLSADVIARHAITLLTYGLGPQG
jgi:hypothetical protein